MTQSMKNRTLGTTGPTLSAIGLRALGMSNFFRPPDDGESIATLRAALDAGVTLIDTGDFYGSGHNELLIREALRGRNRDKVVLSVKFGVQRDPMANLDQELPRVHAAPPWHRPCRRLPS